jgi:hypothetical protein
MTIGNGSSLIHEFFRTTDIEVLDILHQKIIPTIERIAELSPNRIPILETEKRLHRRRKGLDVFGEYAKQVYQRGYSNPNNPGSELCDGGQEQPINIKTVRLFSNKLSPYLLSLTNDVIKIKWVFVYI